MDDADVHALRRYAAAGRAFRKALAEYEAFGERMKTTAAALTKPIPCLEWADLPATYKGFAPPSWPQADAIIKMIRDTHAAYAEMHAAYKALAQEDMDGQPRPPLWHLG